MNHTYFFDTSFFCALVLSDDQYHEQAGNILKDLQKIHGRFYTSSDVVDETVTRLIYISSISTAKKFKTLLDSSIEEGIVQQLFVDEEVQNQAFQFLEKYKDHELSLTDATSIILLRRFTIEQIVSFDSDFKNVGVKCLPN